MKSTTIVLRVSLGVTALFGLVLAATYALGLAPSTAPPVNDDHAALAELLAHASVLHEEAGDEAPTRELLRRAQQLFPDVAALELVRADGRVIVSAGIPRSQWADLESPSSSTGRSTARRSSVAVSHDGRPWATLDLLTLDDASASAGYGREIRFAAFLLAGGFVLSLIYFSGTMRPRGESNGAATARNVFNTFTDGVVVLDREGGVMTANESFAKLADVDVEQLSGNRLETLGWLFDDDEADRPEYPWLRASELGLPQTGVMMRLKTVDGETRVLRVSAAPIRKAGGVQNGVVVSFSDSTLLEERTNALTAALGRLSESREEIQRQNAELHRLATEDSLTDCLNRRALFERFEQEIQTARHGAGPLGCVLVDVDDFKGINDRHGHLAGDEVLQSVAEALRTATGAHGFVGRSGGAEFCVLLPNCPRDALHAFAEAMRSGIAAQARSDIHVTASIAAAVSDPAMSQARDLIEKTDCSLREAKSRGRNQLVVAQETAAM